MFRRIILPICVLVTAPLVAKTRPEPASLTTFFDLGAKDILKLERGKQFLYGGKYKEALSLFKELVAENPDGKNRNMMLMF